MAKKNKVIVHIMRWHGAYKTLCGLFPEGRKVLALPHQLKFIIKSKQRFCHKCNHIYKNRSAHE